MPEHDLMHKIEKAIHKIFLKNKNQPLEIEEIISNVEKELGNGEIDTELTKQTIEKMQDTFALLETPNGKIYLYS